jgi:diguanylate cyclase (GGDEF)-like protein/PAS domain S-box-containing protein
VDEGQSLPAHEWDRICLDNLLSVSRDHLYFKDTRSRFVRASAAVIEAARRPRAELRGLDVRTEADLRGRSDFDLFTADGAQAAYDVEQQVIDSGAPALGLVERQTWPDQPPSYVVTDKWPLRAPDGSIVGTFGVSRDVTGDLLVRRQLESILVSSPDAIARLDARLRFVYVNPAAQTMIGLSEQDILGRSFEELDRSGEFAAAWHAALRRVVDTGEPTQLEHHTGESDEIHYYESRLVAETDLDVVTGVLVLTRDISGRKRAEIALAQRAVLDPLTGLANRTLLLDRLQQSLLQLERSPGMLAVLFFDLDHFKPVNDNLGHAFGDALLVEVAERLQACARRSDTVARFGGDEFVMLCDRVSTSSDARVIADRVTHELASAFWFDGESVRVSASIGITVTTNPRATPGDLLRESDTAMYQAKERGRGLGAVQLFDPSLHRRALSRMALENELRTALDESQLRLHYQPLHDVETGVVRGVEALVRWQHPTRGLLQPHDFMPAAERSGLVLPLGEWVLHEACRQLADWNARRVPLAPLTMAVNLSARQLGNPEVVRVVAEALERSGVPEGLLCIEISETALLEEAVASPEVFAGLRALGVLIALDDFGTGYSSLGHLRRFPVDIIKIDQQFVGGVSAQPASSDGVGADEMVGAITAMAHALGIKTVGEGVETDAQLAGLRRLGCDDAQGYLLTRPLPPDDLAGLVTGI